MAKSIRLKTETQVRVESAVKRFKTDTGVTISDAALVDTLVNEALDVREGQKRKGERGRP